MILEPLAPKNLKYLSNLAFDYEKNDLKIKRKLLNKHE